MCLEYILRATKPERVYLAKFTCDAVIEPLIRLEIPYVFYTIDEKFELAEKIELREGELIMYNNYFGLKDGYCDYLSNHYADQLIIDCSQAYYFKPPNKGFTFFSCRKFFGVADGGCLYSPVKLDESLSVDTSYQKMQHLLKRIDIGAVEAYKDFVQNENKFSDDSIKQMSKLTQRILCNIDFDNVRLARNKNFSFLHQHLKSKNKLSLDNAELNGPLCYPFLTDDKILRQKLIDNKVFVPTYWPNVLDWADASELEYRLAENIIHLPIDQRYDQNDMERVLKVIYG